MVDVGSAADHVSDSLACLCRLYHAALVARDDVTIARVAAVFTFIGLIDMPFIMIAPRLWKGLHPVIFGTDASGEFTFNITPNMLTTLAVCIFAMLLLYLYLLVQRTRWPSWNGRCRIARTIRQVGFEETWKIY